MVEDRTPFAVALLKNTLSQTSQRQSPSKPNFENYFITGSSQSPSLAKNLGTFFPFAVSTHTDG